VPTETEPAPTGSRTVHKAIDVLFALAARPEGMTNQALSSVLGLDKSTSHRLVSTLASRGLVRRDPETRSFVLGPRLFELVTGSTANLTVVARPILHSLSAAVGESASLSLLADRQFICVDAVLPPQELRFSPAVGVSYPLNAGATGKAILAFSAELSTRVLASDELPVFTPNTVASPAELARQLEQVRRDGYATSFEERIAGGCAIAAPLFGPSGAAIGALTISSVVARLPLPQLIRFAPRLQRAAQDLAIGLGYAR